MIHEAQSKVDEIYHELSKHLAADNHALLTGNAGLLMHQVLYHKHNNTGIDDITQDALQATAEGASAMYLDTFCSGAPGVNWFYHYLHSIDLLDRSDVELICFNDDRLKETARVYIRQGNCDFLHGATGLAYYLLYANPNNEDVFYQDFFRELEARFDNENAIIPDFDFTKNRINADYVNLGLAHGIPSILKLCLQFYKKGICTEAAKNVCSKITTYLLTHTNTDKYRSYYPSRIEAGKEINMNSRLAWCYGDLSLAYILYQAGTTFQNREVTKYALQVLRHSTQRRTLEETLAYDAGVCHGSAGIAHIYHRMWHYTSDAVFKKATDFWIQETLNAAIHKDGVAGYKSYDPKNNTWEASHSLLEGAAGVGLVLQSYITGDFSWDYCLMLND